MPLNIIMPQVRVKRMYLDYLERSIQWCKTRLVCFLQSDSIQKSCPHVHLYPSIEWHPIALIFRSKVSCYKQNYIHNPPDSQPPECKEFTHSCASVSQTEAVYAKESQENRIQKSCHKTVTWISVKWKKKERWNQWVIALLNFRTKK